jgi:hypothetical protein
VNHMFETMDLNYRGKRGGKRGKKHGGKKSHK